VRVLLLSSVFPSAARPAYGVFVRERARHVAQRCEVRVVAPVPWFPFNRFIRGGERSVVVDREVDGPLEVYHPRVFSIPAVGKFLDAFFYFASIYAFVRSLRREFRFELIDAHFGYPDGVAAALLGRALGCPVVVTLRGNEVELESSQLRRGQLSWALQSTRVITVSEDLRQLATRLGVARERVCVIANGVDASLFRPGDRHAARARLGLPAERPVLISVGGFVERKGHERVLDLLPELQRSLPGLLYVVLGTAGGGESRLAAIERRARSMAGSVRIEVARPHEEIPLWLNAADVFCLATAREGCCNSILEALACGLPVVTTRVGGNAEIVRHGVDGFLVPYFDAAAFAAAIRKAFEHPWDRQAIAQQAAMRCWQDAGAAVLEEFEQARGGE
jgi:glycosyltransferase involved in cell wall biosynthesis